MSSEEGNQFNEDESSKVNCCFICLIPLEKEAGGNVKERKLIRLLCRYLDIELDQDHGQFLSSDSGKFNENEELEIDLCENCGRTIKLITDQIQLLEVVEMRIRYYLEQVKCAMNKSDGLDNLIESRIANEVRDALFGICSIKTSGSGVRVNLERLTTSQIESYKKVFQVKLEPDDDFHADSFEHAENDDYQSSTETQLEKIPKKRTQRSTMKAINKRRKTKVKSCICDQCGKLYRWPAQLRDHVQSVHLGVKGHMCDLCGREFFQSQTLRIHLAICKGKIPIDLPFQCKLCNRKFARKDYLQEHHKKVHLKIRKCKCDLCGSTFYGVGHLNNHIKVVHESKRFKCEVPGCEKTYANNHVMKVHMRLVHKLEPPPIPKVSETPIKSKYDDKCDVVVVEGFQKFKCKICGFLAKNKIKFREHYTCVHSEQKCVGCGEILRSNWKLKLHRRNCSEFKAKKKAPWDPNNPFLSQ